MIRFKWSPPTLYELTPIIFHMELTHLSSVLGGVQVKTGHLVFQLTILEFVWAMQSFNFNSIQETFVSLTLFTVFRLHIADLRTFNQWLNYVRLSSSKMPFP